MKRKICNTLLKGSSSIAKGKIAVSKDKTKVPLLMCLAFYKLIGLKNKL
jgi:hypothetical protein